jgi:predicted dithiol-disulfide oxidoreductase (DUF899 family)
MERVAVARRELLPGGVVPEDYIFQGAGPNGASTDVRLSELFATGKDALVIYNFMFPRGSSRGFSRRRNRACAVASIAADP